MRHNPEGSEQQGYIDSEEPVEPAWVVLLHGLDNLLDILVRHLSGSNVLKIKNCGPALNFSWYHCLVDDMIEEIVGSCDKIIDAFLKISCKPILNLPPSEESSDNLR